MPRVPRFPPYPKSSHSSGQARIKIHGRAYYLGRHNSPESWGEYNRLLGEWRAGRLQPRDRSEVAPEAVCRTVTGLVARYLAWAEESGRNYDSNRFAYAPLVERFGHMLTTDFDAAALVRWQRAVAGEWCRNHVNRCTSRVKFLFRWGELHGLVPPGQSSRLTVVRGLAEGEYGVRETEEIPPVPEVVVLATLPQLNPVVRALVELLMLTGARPSELFGLRPCDLNRSGSVELARGYRVDLGGAVWAYQPVRHKTAHKGLRRVILFGPRAQEAIKPFLDRPADTPLFRPCEVRAGCRERYDRGTLLQAVERAIARVVGPILRDTVGCPRWTPYQLRHLAATKLAEEFGPDVARIVLGHRTLQMTAVYALDGLARAAAAIREAG